MSKGVKVDWIGYIYYKNALKNNSCNILCQ